MAPQSNEEIKRNITETKPHRTKERNMKQTTTIPSQCGIMTNPRIWIPQSIEMRPLDIKKLDRQIGIFTSQLMRVLLPPYI